MIRNGAVKGLDQKGQIEKKDVILARSGIYVYSRDELVAGGVIPKTNKPFYRMYRPAGVLLAAKDKFDLVPFCREHPPVDVTESNFHQYASGVTGGPIEAVTLDGGEIGLKGRLAFFTRDAYEYYEAGNKEVSTGYVYTVREAKDAEAAGYDYIMESIEDVNHACVTRAGRGGASVRVLDSKTEVYSGNGGVKMKKGFLAMFGIGKAKDSGFAFSGVLLDSVAKVHSLDEAGLTSEIAGVMAHVNDLGDSEAKELLIGAVSDCYKHPVEVLAQKDKIGEKIDELYNKCRAADAEAVKRILDAEGGKDKPCDKCGKSPCECKSEGDGTDGKASAKDSGAAYEAVIDAAVQKAVSQVLSGIDSKITDSVRKTLGLEEVKPAAGVDARAAATDGASGAGEDASFLVRGCFGAR
jgi:hypothetical protein